MPVSSGEIATAMRIASTSVGRPIPESQLGPVAIQGLEAFASLMFDRAMSDVAVAEFPDGLPESMRDGFNLGLLTAVTYISSLIP